VTEEGAEDEEPSTIAELLSTPTPTIEPSELPSSETGPEPAQGTQAYSSPVLIDPDSETSYGCWPVTLRWDWDGHLAQDEYFDVRVWVEGDQAHSGIAWTKTSPHALNPCSILPPGRYFWAVAVIRGRDGIMEEQLSPESENWILNLLGEGPGEVQAGKTPKTPKKAPQE
jgi:hypothetical protein